MNSALIVKKKNYSTSVLSAQRWTAVNPGYVLYFYFLSVLITKYRLPVNLFASIRLNITLAR